MAIQLPADIEVRIQQRVERGEFPNAAEVVREALHMLDARDRQAADLQVTLQSGLDQLDRGEGVPFTPHLMTQIRQDAEERFRRGERPKSDVVP